MIKEKPNLERASYQLKVKLLVIDTNINVYIEAKEEKLTRPVAQPGELPGKL